MDAQSLITLAQIMIALILVLVSVNLYLVLKLKEIDPFAKWNANAINGGMFVIFGVVGAIAAGVTTSVYWDKMILVANAASEHGDKIDNMFWNTMYVTIFVVTVSCGLLFYYSWRYRGKEGRKATFYPENNMLEIIWTVIPAIVLSLLVFDGVIKWHGIFAEPPEDSMKIELTGRQFDWTIRYPGQDIEFGKSSVQYIDIAQNNVLGLNFEDQRSHDDVVTTEIHLVKGKPVNFSIRALDVLHSATLPHFRMKMDAVPGMPTSFWLTPTKTTEEMRNDTGNPDFNYELSCQQICGGGHWNMRRVVIVETQEEYDAWIKDQTPLYTSWKETYGPVDAPKKDLATQEAEEDGAISMK